jgi:hypothetical protein
MPFTVTDSVCGHTVVAALVREHADEQARLADTAGYPSTVQEWETVDLDACPPRDCQRCWRRVSDTLDLMQRVRVADAACIAGVDPFDMVYAYNAVRSMRPEVRACDIAGSIIGDVIPGRVRLGIFHRYEVPSDVPGPSPRTP